MSPSGIQRFDQQGKRQFEGKLEPKDVMLSEAMATSAAVLSSHMGKYEESVEAGLTRLHTILGLDMGATMISDKGYRKKVAYWTHFRDEFLSIEGDVTLHGTIRCDIVAILLPMVTTLFQHYKAVLR